MEQIPSTSPTGPNPGSAFSSPEYLMNLERRIILLESEIQRLTKELQMANSQLNSFSTKLPDIGLLSPNFLKRAFTAYGYTIVAGLIIAIPIYCIIFLISMVNY